MDKHNELNTAMWILCRCVVTCALVGGALLLLTGCAWDPTRLDDAARDAQRIGEAVAPFLGPYGFIATAGGGLAAALLAGLASHKRGRKEGNKLMKEKIDSFNKGREEGSSGR